MTKDAGHVIAKPANNNNTLHISSPSPSDVSVGAVSSLTRRAPAVGTNSNGSSFEQGDASQLTGAAVVAMLQHDSRHHSSSPPDYRSQALPLQNLQMVATNNNSPQLGEERPNSYVFKGDAVEYRL